MNQVQKNIEEQQFLKGRGAQINTANKFHDTIQERNPMSLLEADEHQVRTEFIPVKAKTIVNKVDSPDIGMAYSINPYQGCEHGCVYCYARNTHTYWGYSAGLDFEQKILIKHDAPALLDKALRKKNWEVRPIMLSGNTDCYQPAEKKFKLTRQILEVLWKHRHPVGIITKNSMVLRDLDILEKMAEHNLVHVSISVTTLNEELRQFLEPRTASCKNRLSTIQQLSEKGIPVNVMMAPIIPGLTEHEIFNVARETSAAGALSMAYTMVRLNGDIGEIFEDWIRKTYPDRADKVLNKIKECHNGNLSDHRFGKRMRGEGNIAEIIANQFKLAKRLYFKDKVYPPYDKELYYKFKHPQMSLF